MVEQKSEAIVSQPGEHPDALFMELDRRDEMQIISELEGAFLKEMVYEVKGQVRLSWAGVKEVARRMGSIKLIELKREETPTHWIVDVKARDEINKLELWGSAMQSKTMTIKETGKEVPDEFCYVKAVSKAQRNAMRAVIPEAMIQTLIQAHVDAKRGPRPAAVPEPVAGIVKPQIIGPAEARNPPKPGGVQQQRDTPPPASKSMRDAAIDTIRTFQAIGTKHNSKVWEILSTRGFNIGNWPGWDGLSEEDLAYVLKEVESYIEADTKAGAEAFKTAGKLG